MSLPEIKFKRTGGPVIAEITCGYAQPGSYTLLLWEANENKIVMEKRGNFINPDDDAYALPTPNSENDGRIIECIATVVIIPGIKKYNVELKLYQGGRELKPQIADSNESNSPSVTVDLFARLKLEEEASQYEETNRSNINAD